MSVNAFSKTPQFHINHIETVERSSLIGQRELILLEDRVKASLFTYITSVYGDGIRLNSISSQSNKNIVSHTISGKNDPVQFAQSFLVRILEVMHPESTSGERLPLGWYTFFDTIHLDILETEITPHDIQFVKQNTLFKSLSAHKELVDLTDTIRSMLLDRIEQSGYLVSLHDSSEQQAKRKKTSTKDTHVPKAERQEEDLPHHVTMSLRKQEKKRK